jgi:phage tail sheath protein FI
MPVVRPDATFSPKSRPHGGYHHSNTDGDDGGPLSDYDVIGSATDRTGLFALAGVEHLGFVYIPPLTRTTDVGASTLLVAAKFCRERRAVLIVDPPGAWTSVEAAVRGSRNLNFSSDQAVMFFPRVVAHDRLRGRSETFANGGVIAGMLSRMDARKPVWAVQQPEPDYVPRGSVRLTCTLTEAERWRLAANGINALQAAKSAAPVRLLARTLAGGAHVSADWGYLASRRFALFIVDAIERGTRWVVWSTPDPAVWRRVVRQVNSFMSDLVAQGSFGEVPASQAFFVICDERVNHMADINAGRCNIVLGFAALRRGEYHTVMVTHTLSGTSVRTIAVNRYEMPTPLSLELPSAAAVGLQD